MVHKNGFNRHEETGVCKFFSSVGFYSFLVSNVFYVYFLLGLEGMGLIPERNRGVFPPLESL
jgi:hypothetical protein